MARLGFEGDPAQLGKRVDGEFAAEAPVKWIMASLRGLPVEQIRRWTVSGTEIPPFVA